LLQNLVDRVYRWSAILAVCFRRGCKIRIAPAQIGLSGEEVEVLLIFFSARPSRVSARQNSTISFDSRKAKPSG
jgi:hypothetical protein